MQNSAIVLILFVTLNFISVIHGARILGVVLTPSFSHQVMYRPLWKELSLRGHKLMLLTTDPIHDPNLTNLTEIDLSFSYDIWTKDMAPIMNDPKHVTTMMDQSVKTMYKVVDQQLGLPEVQKLLNNQEEHFDLAIVEILMSLAVAFPEKFKCPYIATTSLDGPTYFYNLIGNPVNPITNPDINLPFEGKLSFLERIRSTIYQVLMPFFANGYLLKGDLIVRKHFDESFPSLLDIANNMSALFVNTNPILNQIRPLMPNVVQIGGGTHRQSFKPLPKELKEHLDNATEGAIYFSLGSNVKSKFLTDDVKTVLMETFAELPYKVLWKFELEDLPGKPDNIIISKWFPQQDIFKHPNIKLFITQGGIQSIEEAIYDHIPMLGLPFFMDQPTNIKRMVAKGLGLSLDYKTLDKETLKETILEIIINPKYRNRVKEMADLALDQPMTGLEKAVWWTEYVIRHKGAKHLRSPLLDIPSYQYYLLDVIGFCIAVVMIVIYLIVLFFRLVRGIIRTIFCRAKSKVKTN